MKIGKIFFNIVLWALALVTIIPFVWMFLSSFAPNSAIVSINGGFFPTPTTLDNYKGIQEKFDFLRLFANSLFITIVKTIIILYSSALLGYVFAKMQFHGRGLLFAITLSTMMIPWAVTIIPQYEMMQNFGLFDSYWALILPGMINGFGIFQLRQAMSEVPDEIVEAARVDGASETRIFHSIMIPMCRNGIAALGIFVFLWNWEDYLWPFLMISDEEKQLLSVGLKAFNGQFGTDYGGLFAATSLAIIPVLLVYLTFQKQFIAGIASGSSKG